MFWYSLPGMWAYVYLWSGCLLFCLWGLVVEWLVGSCLYVEILYRADAFYLGFRGGVVRLSSFG